MPSACRTLTTLKPLHPHADESCRASKVSATLNGVPLRTPIFDNQGKSVLVPGVQVRSNCMWEP